MNTQPKTSQMQTLYDAMREATTRPDERYEFEDDAQARARWLQEQGPDVRARLADDLASRLGDFAADVEQEASDALWMARDLGEHYDEQETACYLSSLVLSLRRLVNDAEEKLKEAEAEAERHLGPDWKSQG